MILKAKDSYLISVRNGLELILEVSPQILNPLINTIIFFFHDLCISSDKYCRLTQKELGEV